ncbi:methylmalonyl-CoA epimerase [Cytophagaceae bacterium ABcell3]|nr:methylmalonyl-CoA epimerase [Cytophagaceae bacterium ABcell3]
MMKLEHIGIAVRDVQKAIDFYENLLGTKVYKIEEVPSEKVRTYFLQTDNTKIELLEAMAPDSPISKFLEKRGEGMHHMAFEVEDIVKEMKRLKEEGYQLLNEKPKAGADGKQIFFMHPKESNGVLIELCGNS